MRGKFITLEGCDGVGKSTQIRLLKKHLTEHNIAHVFTREPGGTDISERIRKIILDPSCMEMDDYTELLLYVAARRQHVAEFIEKKLQEGITVFCDRFIDSTMAYQGYGRGISKEAIAYCNALALGNTKIDVTIFFDLSPKEAFGRKGGADRKDRLECQKFDFYTRVYEGYKEIALIEPRVAVVDAHGSAEDVNKRLLSVLRQRGIL